MIDETYKGERYIAQYHRNSDEFICEVELLGFDLFKFQKHFCVSDKSNPMFDCFSIKKEDFDFLKEYIAEDVRLNFHEYDFFLEAKDTE